MFPMNGSVSCLIVLAAMLSVVCSGCGSSNSKGMSQAQAQAVSEQVSGAVAQALSNAFSSGNSAGNGAVRGESLSTQLTSIRPDQSYGCTQSGSGQNCNWPVSYNTPCPQGGTIAVTGDLETTLNGSGSGPLSSQLTLTPANCGISNTIVNGNPNVAVGVKLNFVNSVPVFPITINEGGNISYGPNPSGTCSVQLTYTITSATSCTSTGTVCGQSVSGACSLSGAIVRSGESKLYASLR